MRNQWKHKASDNINKHEHRGILLYMKFDNNIFHGNYAKS